MLESNGIDIWRIDMEPAEPPSRADRLCLSPDEVDRASAYKHSSAAIRFLRGRLALRRILSAYVKCHPKDLRFSCEANGKPILISPASPGSLVSFNLSHTDSLALCAVSMHHPVGVDVEYAARIVEMDSIAARFFSPPEVAFLRSLPATERRVAFYRLWTCKEACVKATGLGLTQLAHVKVRLSPAPSVRIPSTGPWSVCEFIPEAGYTAAVVFPGGQTCCLHGWLYEDKPGCHL